MNDTEWKKTDDNGITTVMAISWSAEDVTGIANEMDIPLTKEQVGEILDRLFDKHDAEWGICWETIRTVVSEYRSSGLKVDKDFIFEYKGNGDCESKCRVRTICDPDSDELIVLITELEDNPGTSITNMIEEVVKGIVIKLGHECYDAVWIEHYPPCVGVNAYDTFDYVGLDYSGNFLTNPKWERVETQLANDIANII